VKLEVGEGYGRRGGEGGGGSNPYLSRVESTPGIYFFPFFQSGSLTGEVGRSFY
jgi:hypothetical protein